jgi:hypothetical protein
VVLAALALVVFVFVVQPTASVLRAAVAVVKIRHY